jgi:hypothetical protein
MDGEAKASEEHIAIDLKKKNKNSSRTLWMKKNKLEANPKG